MLAKNLESIISQFSRGIVQLLQKADLKELAEALPAVQKALKAASNQAARGGNAPVKGARKAALENKRRSKAEAEANAALTGRWLREKILKALVGKTEGMRNEEIQKKLGARPEDTRDALAALLQAGRIERHGQARGTRYRLAAPGGAERAAPKPAPKPAPRPRAQPAPPEPPIEVSSDMIDRVRAELLDRSSPVTLKELGQNLRYKREELKAILDHMLQHGLAEREGAGLGVRYKLAAHAPAEGRSHKEGTIVRRIPGSKDWTEVPKASAAEASAEAPAAEPVGES